MNKLYEQFSSEETKTAQGSINVTMAVRCFIDYTNETLSSSLSTCCWQFITAKWKSKTYI